MGVSKRGGGVGWGVSRKGHTPSYDIFLTLIVTAVLSIVIVNGLSVGVFLCRLIVKMFDRKNYRYIIQLC